MATDQIRYPFQPGLAILVGMGYNPNRKFTARPGDYVLLAAGLLAAAALVVWGFL